MQEKKVILIRTAAHISFRKVSVNIDVSSWARSIKNNYIWLPRVRSFPIINNFFSSKANVILGTISNREWVAVIHPSTGDSRRFWVFFKVQEKLWSDLWQETSRAPVILVDNATIHWLLLTKSIWEDQRISFIHIPPYCPEVAPVELIFRALKSKLVSSEYIDSVNFTKIEGMELIANWLEALSFWTWKRAWNDACKEIKQTLISSPLNISG